MKSIQPLLFGLGLILGLVVGLPQDLGATTILPVDAGRAVDRSELIFVGQAVAHEVHLTVGDQTPFTFVTFAVDEVLKGRVQGDEITLRFLGGPVDDEVLEVAGTPKFDELGRYLLFVAGNGRTFMPLVGWGQGKLDLLPHPVTGEDMVVDHRGVPVLGLDGGSWSLSHELRLDADGWFRAAEDDGVEVLWQDGVDVVDEQVERLEKASAAVTPAAVVLDHVRSLVEARRPGRDFRSGRLVPSASAHDLPETLSFQAVAPR